MSFSFVTPAKAGAQPINKAAKRRFVWVLGPGLRRGDGVGLGRVGGMASWSRKLGYVYIMASKRNGTLYIGVTSDLAARVWQHRNGAFDGFTKKYGCKMLVWYAAFDRIEDAIRREKQMKEWRRDWKLRVIEGSNWRWDDLSPSLFGPLGPGLRRGDDLGEDRGDERNRV